MSKTWKKREDWGTIPDSRRQMWQLNTTHNPELDSEPTEDIVKIRTIWIGSVNSIIIWIDYPYYGYDISIYGYMDMISISSISIL